MPLLSVEGGPSSVAVVRFLTRFWPSWNNMVFYSKELMKKYHACPLNNFLKYSTFHPNVLSQHLEGYSPYTGTISRKQRNHLQCLVNVTTKHVTIMFLSVATIYLLRLIQHSKFQHPHSAVSPETGKSRRILRRDNRSSQTVAGYREGICMIMKNHHTNNWYCQKNLALFCGEI